MNTVVTQNKKELIFDRFEFNKGLFVGSLESNKFWSPLFRLQKGDNNYGGAGADRNVVCLGREVTC